MKNSISWSSRSFLPRSTQVLLAVFGILSLITSVRAQSIFQWAGNGHYYQLVSTTNDITWTDAKSAAEAAGGYLVTLTSSSENAFVFSLIQNNNSMWNPVAPAHGPWIGAYQPDGSGEPASNWQWVTGETFSFSNWRSGEPNNAGGNEKVALFTDLSGTRSAFWADLAEPSPNANDNVKSYIIEYNVSPIPEPATYAVVMAAAAAGVVVFRTRSRRNAGVG